MCPVNKKENGKSLLLVVLVKMKHEVSLGTVIFQGTVEVRLLGGSRQWRTTAVHPRVGGFRGPLASARQAWLFSVFSGQCFFPLMRRCVGLGDLQPAGAQEPHQDVHLQMTDRKHIHACALEGERCQGQDHGDTREEFSPKRPDPEFLEAWGG